MKVIPGCDELNDTDGALAPQATAGAFAAQATDTRPTITATTKSMSGVTLCALPAACNGLLTTREPPLPDTPAGCADKARNTLSGVVAGVELTACTETPSPRITASVASGVTETPATEATNSISPETFRVMSGTTLTAVTADTKSLATATAASGVLLTAAMPATNARAISNTASGVLLTAVTVAARSLAITNAASDVTDTPVTEATN